MKQVIRAREEFRALLKQLGQCLKPIIGGKPENEFKK